MYPYLAPYYKNSKYIGLNVKSKTVNLVEVNKIQEKIFVTLGQAKFLKCDTKNKISKRTSR